MTIPLIDTQPAVDADRTRSLVRVLGVVLALLLAGGVAGVATIDSEAGREGHVAAVLSAVERTADGPSSRMLFSVEIKANGPASPAVLTMEGVIDPKSRAIVAQLKGSMMRAEVLSDGKTAWARTFGPGARGGSRPWVGVSEAAIPEEESTPLDGLLGGGMVASPGALLESLKQTGHVKDVQVVGRADVRGASTTVYRVTLDEQKFRESLLAGSADGRESPSGAKLQDPVAELSVGDDGLVRRSRVEMAFGAGGTSVSMVTTTEFWDFGVPVDVKPPPPQDVQMAGSVEEFERLLLGGG